MKNLQVLKQMKWLVMIAAVVLISALIISYCACEETSTKSPTSPSSPDKPVVVTIGNLTDKSGVASESNRIIDMALEDMVSYYNEQNLIPGIQLKVISYDTQYDPALDIEGYEWLKENGADLFFTSFAHTAITLKDFLEEDKLVLFTLAPTKEAVTPPGYVFGLGTLPTYEAYTLLKWIAENDYDFPNDRKARFGCASIPDPYGKAITSGVEQYIEANSQQFVLVATSWVDLWSFPIEYYGPVSKLISCDYVLIPTFMNQYIDEYRSAGGNARFVGTGSHITNLNLIEEENLWDKLDGSIFALTSRWWNEDDAVISIVKTLLWEKHPEEAELIMDTRNEYLSAVDVYIMLAAISNAVQIAGPDDFDSQSLYETTLSFHITVDGCQYSYSESKRTSNDFLGIHEAIADVKDLARIQQEWRPLICEP